MKGIFITQNNKINLSPYSLITTNVIMLMGLFYFSCENTITDIPIDINYGVVINEINYRPSIPGDWVELYNPTDETIAIGLWMLKDDNDDHVFTIPENTIISANDFIVLCKDVAAFENLFSEVNNIGDFGFGLGGGDQVRLFDSSEQLVDKVEYDEEDPWPTEPDGTGPILELIHPSLDNNRAENWAASNSNNGTPGEINSVYDDE
jgi:hypothetical protein